MTFGELAAFISKEDTEHQSSEELMCKAEVSRRTGNIVYASQLLNTALARATVNAQSLLPNVYWAQANLRRQIGDHTGSLLALSSAHRLATASGDSMRAAAIDAAKAEIVRIKGQYPAAWQMHSRLEQWFRERGDSRGVVWAIQGKAQILLMSGHGHDARRWFEQSIAIATEANDLRSVAFGHRGIGNALIAEGVMSEARPHLANALRIFTDVGYLIGIGYTLRSFAKADMRSGNIQLARERLHEARNYFYCTHHTRGIAWINQSKRELHLTFEKGK